MKVALHAGQMLQPVPGGIGRYVAALCRELPGLGVEVEAFASGGRPASLDPAIGWSDLGFPTSAVRYELWHRARRPRVRVPGELVHAPSLAVPPRGGRPLVVTAHDVAFLRHPETTTARGRRFHERGLALARRDADLVIAVSEFTRAELLAHGFRADRVRAVLNGCDPAPEIADEIVSARVAATGVSGRYLLTVGTVEPRKRLPVLLEAFRSLRARHPDVTLVIVGPDGWGEVGRIEGPAVSRLGRLPWSQVDALYRRAVACCITSVYEGFGLPAAEAMARGCPVIAASSGALTEVIGDAGMLVAPDDPEATAAAIAEVLENDALGVDLAARGLRRVATMTWRRAAEAHARVYHDVAAMARDAR